MPYFAQELFEMGERNRDLNEKNLFRCFKKS